MKLYVPRTFAGLRFRAPYRLAHNLADVLDGPMSRDVATFFRNQLQLDPTFKLVLGWPWSLACEGVEATLICAPDDGFTPTDVITFLFNHNLPPGVIFGVIPHVDEQPVVANLIHTNFGRARYWGYGLNLGHH